MSTITQLRSYKEPTKEELIRAFFNIPQATAYPTPAGQDKIDINAVVAVEDAEESFVRLQHDVSSSHIPISR
jgi:hypothetical protein